MGEQPRRQQCNSSHPSYTHRMPWSPRSPGTCLLGSLCTQLSVLAVQLCLGRTASEQWNRLCRRSRAGTVCTRSLTPGRSRSSTSQAGTAATQPILIRRSNLGWLGAAARWRRGTRSPPGRAHHMMGSSASAHRGWGCTGRARTCTGSRPHPSPHRRSHCMCRSSAAPSASSCILWAAASGRAGRAARIWPRRR